ncbi:conserved exported hypothetical protein [Vibrio chagasii]|nr:conserved exported hypothetical protein [Vibrio chagasii]
MKHIIFLFLASLTLAPYSFAALAPSEGFSGNMTFLTGFTANSSNLDVGQSNHQSQADLMSSGNTEAEGMVAVLGSVQYTFGALNHKQFFLGTSRDDIITGTLAFEIGYRQQVENGMVVDFSILPTLISGEVWDDPYAVDSKREEADVTGTVVRMQLSRIMGSNFNLDVASGESDVKKENTGLKGLGLTEEERALMIRERKYFYLKSGYQYLLKDGSGIFTPSMNVVSSDSEGDALSFLSLGAEINLAKMYGNHGLALTLMQQSVAMIKRTQFLIRREKTKTLEHSSPMNIPISLMLKTGLWCHYSAPRPRIQTLSITNHRNTWFP